MRFRTVTTGLLLTAAAAAVAVPLVGSASAASAAVTTAAVSNTGPTGLSASVRTALVNRPDGGGPDNITWALDNLARTMTITLVGEQNGQYEYTAALHDTGTFTTVKGAPAPNQTGRYDGTTEQASKTGVMTGYADFSFTANSLPTLGTANLGVPVVVPGSADSTAAWYELAFPAGTQFGGPGLGNWGWSYTLGHGAHAQHWADTYANGDGQDAGDGNIAA